LKGFEVLLILNLKMSIHYWLLYLCINNLQNNLV